MKNDNFKELIKDMGSCHECLNLKSKSCDCSLVNIYDDQDFALNIPSIWTDWLDRLDAKVMIIGQDWGPIRDMKRIYQEYSKDRSIANKKRIINEEKSLTKKMLEKFLMESSKMVGYTLDDNFMDKVYVTNAIMCARKGENYRGNNIKLKTSTINCSKYLKWQIEIVKPKVIITLGYYPLLSLAKIYGFEISKTLSETIDNKNSIEIDDIVIIPAFHPTAQVPKNKQLEQYKKIWKYIK